MRILVFGRTGQVAQALRRRAPAGVQLTALGREEADLMNPAACARLVTQSEADAVILAAAWTAVDRAETEPDAARIVNGEAPAAIARAAAARGLPLVHLSTDYVFPGTGGGPWRPQDPVAPLNAYGRSKRLGEEGVLAAGGRAVILRTSWVFSAQGTNFVKTMLRLGRERESLRVVADQQGGPTPADAIAEACLDIAAALREGADGGIHHLSGAPDTTWAGFAEAIMAEAGLRTRIEPIATADYPTPARRPLDSRLDCTSLAEAFGIPRPDWRAALREVLAELR